MKNPIDQFNDWNLRRKAANSGAEAAHQSGVSNPEAFLKSERLGIPDRLRIDPQKAQAELFIAEQTVTSLSVQHTNISRTYSLRPNPWSRRLKVAGLYLLEFGTLSYLFITEFGYDNFSAFATAVLYTAGTFAATKIVFKNLSKDAHERAWYTPVLAVVVLLGGVSIIALRLANRPPDASLLSVLPAAIIAGMVTLLPGGIAAGSEIELDEIHQTTIEYESICVELRREQLRVEGYRENIHASTPADLQLLDSRAQLSAIYQNAFDKAAGSPNKP